MKDLDKLYTFDFLWHRTQALNLLQRTIVNLNILWGNVSVSEWLTFHAKRQCPIHNGSLETFIWSIKRNILSHFCSTNDQVTFVENSRQLKIIVSFYNKHDRECKCNLKWPPWKDGNVWFTAVSLKPLLDQYCGRYCRFLNWSVLNSVNSCMLSFNGKSQVTFVENSQFEIENNQISKL